ncbi:MAG TPA: translocation/assembly module TamB domain-containing protein, partial [Candidatus Binatia bacterium]|nr:translocation/assembly module TamB domain-containing protein [Candidatus Binatia bacterium]
ALEGLSGRQLVKAQLVSGGLLGPLSVADLSYENRSVRVEIDRAELTWSPRALLRHRLVIDRLVAGRVRVTFKRVESAPTEPGELITTLPLGLDLRDIVAEVLEVQLAADAEPQRFERLRFSGRWLGEHIEVGLLELFRPGVGVLRIDGAAALEPRGVRVSALRLHAPVALELKGYWSYRDASDLQLAWQKLQWPLEGEPQVLSQAGSAHIRGRPDGYQLTLDTRLAALDLAASVHAEGSGDLQHVELAALHAGLLAGTLDLAGQFRWLPQVQLALAGEARGLDPGQRWPEWPGRLNAAIAADTALAQGQAPLIHFTVQAHDSLLRGYRLAAQADGHYRDGVLDFAQLDLSSGASRLKAKGRVLPTLDLAAELNSPRLQELLPAAAGSAHLSAQLHGKPSRPQGTLRGRADALAYRKRRAKSATLDATIDLNRDSRIDLQLRGVQAGVPVEAADLHLAGPLAGHRIELKLAGSGSTAQLAARGALDLDALRWRGELVSGQIAPRGLAGWTLEAPAALSASAHELDLAPACWRSTDARACARLLRMPAATRVAVRLENFDFAYFRSLFPPDWSLAGSVSGSGYADLAGNGLSDLSADFQTTGGAWRSGTRTLLEFLPGSAQAKSLPDGRTHLLLDVPFTHGGVKLDAMLAPGADFMRRPLSGTVRAEVPDLTFLRMLTLEIERASGRIDGELQLAGTPAQPRATGRIALADGSLRLVTPGIEVTAITAQLEGASQAGQLKLTAQGSSGGGSLNLDGTLDTGADGGRHALLKIGGKDFQAMNTPDARIWVSPELQLAYDKDGLRLTGSVLVPHAEITPQRFDNGVSASRDQVIVGAQEEQEKGGALKLTSEVEVRLGDQVSFDGSGLKTRLTGTVGVFDQPGRVTSARGELRLVGGQYKAYGQDLQITTGRLLFTDGPLTKPALEIRAERKPREDITVGVYVRGYLDAPLFNLYSTPAMPQERQLSWLVLGRPLEDTGASSDQRSVLASAALSLGLTGSDYLAKRFHDNLGIDEISIGARPGEANDQARLTIGKYLSPKLFVSYGLGLFEAGNILRLRYDVGHGFKLQTETGVESGGDVLYSIER